MRDGKQMKTCSEGFCFDGQIRNQQAKRMELAEVTEADTDRNFFFV